MREGEKGGFSGRFSLYGVLVYVGRWKLGVQILRRERGALLMFSCTAIGFEELGFRYVSMIRVYS